MNTYKSPQKRVNQTGSLFFAAYINPSDSKQNFTMTNTFLGFLSFITVGAHLFGPYLKKRRKKDFFSTTSTVSASSSVVVAIKLC